MCRFKKIVGKKAYSDYCFNTSYVSVQEIVYISIKPVQKCFNTSYVSVQALPNTLFLSFTMFQYILCVGSSKIRLYDSRAMLKFQYILCVGSSLMKMSVSMRDYCFNTSYVSVQVKKGYFTILASKVSIHPMCRFKITDTPKATGPLMFQYILCVGSRKENNAKKRKKTCFNTSYVSVQVSPSSSLYLISMFQYILCVGSSC